MRKKQKENNVGVVCGVWVCGALRALRVGVSVWVRVWVWVWVWVLVFIFLFFAFLDFCFFGFLCFSLYF